MKKIDGEKVKTERVRREWSDPCRVECVKDGSCCRGRAERGVGSGEGESKRSKEGENEEEKRENWNGERIGKGGGREGE